MIQSVIKIYNRSFADAIILIVSLLMAHIYKSGVIGDSIFLPNTEGMQLCNKFTGRRDFIQFR